MPNYIKNRLKLTGNQQDVKNLISRFSTFHQARQKTSFDGNLTFTDGNCNYGWLNQETNIFERRGEKDVKSVPDGWSPLMDEAWTRFPDFDKVVPMPESLTMDGLHSGIETAINAALKMSYSDNDLIKMLEIKNRQDFKSPLELNDQEFEIYIQGLRNVKEHGFVSWYNWSVEHWGTKWNTMECYSENGYYYFDTAWSGVPEMIEKIHIEFPSVRIEYKYSDEDTGSNCGIAIYENGNSNFTRLENGSNEAYELAFELRPEYKENYKIVDGSYVYHGED